MKNKDIGVFDSGLGGISVLNRCRELMPEENYIYYADKLNAPYGDKTSEDIVKLMEDVIENIFLKRDVKAIVIACNTATNAAVDTLRKKYDIPIIGTEPAIKPALLHNNNDKKTLILATEATINSKRFLNKLITYNENEYIIMGCSGLVELIESENNAGIKEYFKVRFSKLDLDSIGSVVLGCTHYPFIKKYIKDALNKDVTFFDGGDGVARRLSSILEENKIRSISKEIGLVDLSNSLDNEYNQKLDKYVWR